MKRATSHQHLGAASERSKTSSKNTGLHISWVSCQENHAQESHIPEGAIKIINNSNKTYYLKEKGTKQTRFSAGDKKKSLFGIVILKEKPSRASETQLHCLFFSLKTQNQFQKWHPSGNTSHMKQGQRSAALTAGPSSGRPPTATRSLADRRFTDAGAGGEQRVLSALKPQHLGPSLT